MIIGLTSAARINPYATLLIDALGQRGVPVSFVVSEARGVTGDVLERLQRRGLAGALRALRRRAGTVSTGPQPLAEAASARGLDLRRPLSQVCEPLGIGFDQVQRLSSRAAADAVKERGADVLINAGGGLFRRQLLRAPRRGMLNAHMARLPQVRGVDVLPWSVLLGEAPGVTVHWIDGGIDTGGVLAFAGLQPVPGDNLESLRERAVLLSVDLICAQVVRLASGEPAAVQQEDTAGLQYFALHPRLLARAAACLATDDANPIGGARLADNND